MLICSDIGLRGSYRMLCLGKSILALAERRERRGMPLCVRAWYECLWSVAQDMVFGVSQEEGWLLLEHSQGPNTWSSNSPVFLSSLI